MTRAYLMDCMDAMRVMPDNAYDLAVVDPPYFAGPERRGFYGSKTSKIGVHRDYYISPKWEVPGEDYFRELARVSRHYIIWGCNILILYSTRGELCGISAMDQAAFQIVKLPLQTYMTACEWSNICGTE